MKLHLAFMALNPLLMHGTGEVDHLAPSRSAAEEGFTSAHSDLLELPTELLYMICEQLQLSSALALTLTCNHLYYAVVAAKYVHQAVKQLSKTEEEEFDLRRALEDACLVKGYHCQGCRKRNTLRTISQNEELAKDTSSDRYRLRTKICFRMT